MKYALAALLFSLLSLRALGAAGDIVSVSINSDGYHCDLTVAGLSTGGTYDFGWSGSTNDPATSTEKMVFTVTSLGYSDTGTATTKVRTVYGTKQFRKPYPDQAQNQETVSGANVVIRIALSEYIFDSDTATVDLLSGLYTQAATPSAAANNLAVTNGSAAAYRPVQFVWTGVPLQRLTASTFSVRAWASHHSAEQGRPVRAVTFTATDGTTTRTVTRTAMEIDPQDGDSLSFPEYVATFTTGDFAQGSTITVNAQAFPWVGDAGSVFNSTSFATSPSYFPGPQTFYCDKDNAYGVTMALVATDGNNGTALAYDAGSYNADTAMPFATAAAAAEAIRAYNSANRSRNDVGGGVVEFEAGSFAWLGATGTFGSTPATYITLRPRSGLVAGDVIFSTSSGATDISDRIKLEKIKLTTTGSGPTSCGALWLDRCILDSAGTGVISGNGYVWATGCTVPQWAQGLKQFSTGSTAGYTLVRGCDFTGFRHQIITPAMIGNIKNNLTTPTAGQLIKEGNGGIQGPPTNTIIAYNKLMGISGIGIKFADIPKVDSWVRGCTIANNLFESISNSTSLPLFGISTSKQANQPVDDVLIWNNVMIGERHIVAYNDSGDLPVYYNHWDMVGNIAWEYNIKPDTHPNPTQNGARIGNWSLYHGVNYSGNVHADSGTADQFNNRFAGLSTSQVSWGSDYTYYDFVDYKATIVTGGGGVGGGDYHLGASSPARDIAVRQPLPYDLEGAVRGLPDSAGVYTTYNEDNAFPVVTITTPATGATSNSPALFAATATDAEDGTISSSIIWTSDIDGALGTGATINPSLTVGVHTITATITDAGGRTDSDAITITITTSPVGGTIQATRVNAGTITIQ